MRLRKLTLEEIKARLKLINPDVEILSDEYKNAKTKLKCECLLDGKRWYATWSNLSKGRGCPECARRRSIVDLRGKKFGRLTVVELSRTQKVKNGTKLYWLCKCECGNEIETIGSSLTTGNTKSCGCLKKETSSRNAKRKVIDISGKRYGRLIVVKRAGNIGNKTSWLCKCDCGNMAIVSKSNLVTGSTRSCGCYAVEKSNEKLRALHRKQNEKFEEVGNKYGRLLVLKEAGRDINGSRRWLCKCDCGNTHVVSGYRLRNGNTKSCGCYNVDSHSGANNKRYRHDLTDEERMKNRYQLYGKHLKKWSRSVFVRDKFTCQVCGSYSVDLHAHHLDGWNWCKEKRFDVSNGITLCKECHFDFHRKYGRGDNTSEQFDEYMRNYTQHV